MCCFTVAWEKSAHLTGEKRLGYKVITLSDTQESRVVNDHENATFGRGAFVVFKSRRAGRDEAPGGVHGCPTESVVT